MAYNTGWQYDPTITPLGQITAQTQAEGNPKVGNDTGNASASTPFLSAALQQSTTSQLSSWGSVAAANAQGDAQAVNNQMGALQYKNAKDAQAQAQARLAKLQSDAEKASKANRAKVQGYVTAAQQNLAGVKNSLSTNSYSYSTGGGTGPRSSSHGVSAAGQHQLSVAQSDGYSLTAANYDRSYNYNNAYSVDRNAVLADAYSWLGTSYQLGAETKQQSVDCSGLVQSVYSQLGFSIPQHLASWQRDNIPGVRTSFSNLQPGDLVAWNDGSHIAIYAGNGQIIEAANTRVGTVRRALWCDPSQVTGIHLTFADEGRARGQGYLFRQGGVG